MTEREFNLIKERLAKWREERHLTYENQQAGFLGNVYEEVSEYFRAKNDLEKIDALCDIAVLIINSFEFLEYVSFAKINKKSIFEIIEHLNSYFIEYRDKIKYYNEYKEFEYLMIIEIEYLVNILGFDFYKCMLQTIKEIESRCGYYNITLKKFVKNTGAYSKTEALDLAKSKNTPNKYFVDKEDNDYWYIKIEDNNGDYEIYCIKKWYKADYESCRL